MANQARPSATRVQTTDSAILKIGEYGYPIGHLGHLTESQEEALIAFKKLCQEKGLYKEASDINQSSHDDTTLLRFLRARRFVVQDAFQQFSETEKWRKDNQIGDLYENIDVNDYEETRVLYPQWTGRRDKRGIPVYVFEVAPLNSKTMSAYAKSSASTSVGSFKRDTSTATTPPRLLRLFALYENLTCFILPLCSKLRDRDNPDTPISQSNNIVDISNVGFKQFWNLRTHMQDASTLATAHYPETLDRIFIIGAPSFFPTVWGWIKRWFDPITTSKIFILSPEKAFRTLSTFIEPANIPKKYGGQLNYEYGMAPVLDPAEEQHIVWTSPDPIPSNRKWPKGPVKWIPQKDGTMLAMAVGSVNGKERREVVATLYPDGKTSAPQVQQPAEAQQLSETQSSAKVLPPAEAQSPAQAQTPVQAETVTQVEQPAQLEQRADVPTTQAEAHPVHSESPVTTQGLSGAIHTEPVAPSNGSSYKPMGAPVPYGEAGLVNGQA